MYKTFIFPTAVLQFVSLSENYYIAYNYGNIIMYNVSVFIQHLKHFYRHKKSFWNKYIVEKSIALPRFLCLEFKIRVACVHMITLIIVYLFVYYNNIVDVIGISCWK